MQSVQISLVALLLLCYNLVVVGKIYGVSFFQLYTKLYAWLLSTE